MYRHDKLLTHFKGYLIGRRYYKAQLALEVMLTSMSGMLRKDGVTPIWAHSLSLLLPTLETFPFLMKLWKKF